MQEKVIQITGSITVDELANALGLSVTTLIGQLFKEGIVATINYQLKYTALSFFMVQFYDIMCILLGKTRRKGGDKNEQDF